jgi:Txe/YoeB family toxin of Txe-Axe toxin-antitoxin module
MTLAFSSAAWDDYLYWQKTDKQILKRINLLIRDIIRSPYEGIGKPADIRFMNHRGQVLLGLAIYGLPERRSTT